MENGKSSGKAGALVIVPIFCAPFILYGLGILTAPLFIGYLMLALFLMLLMVRFETGFLIIIVMRSSLDFLRNFSGAPTDSDSGFNLAALVGVALIALGVAYVLFRKVDIFRYEDTPFFLLFLGITAVSVFYSQDLKTSLSDWLRLVSVYSVYLLARIIFATPSKVRAAFIGVLLSSLAPIALACVQLVTRQGLSLDGTQARIVGTFLHPNAFASYLLILLIFCISQCLERERLVPAAFLKILASFISVIFVFTYSRGAWIAFVIAILLLGFFRHKKLLFFLPIILLLVMFAIPSTKARIDNIYNPGYTHGRSAWAWRQDTWREILPLVYKRPILGHGLATVETEFGVLTHNDYLRLLAETGILGLLAYLLLMLRLLGSAFRDFQRARSELVRGLQMALMAMVVGFLIREFADNTLRNTVVMVYFWLVVALIRNMGQLDVLSPNLRRGAALTKGEALEA